MWNKELEFDKKRLFRLVILLYDAGGYSTFEISKMLTAFMNINGMIKDWHLVVTNGLSPLDKFLESINYGGASKRRIEEIWMNFMHKQK